VILKVSFRRFCEKKAATKRHGLLGLRISGSIHVSLSFGVSRSLQTNSVASKRAVQNTSFRPKLLTPHVSSAAEKSAYLPRPSPSPNWHSLLHLHLPLQVSAVILNAVKDPEEFHPAQPPGPFQAILSRRHCCCFAVAISSSSSSPT
jgi:hypothetical protein